MMADEIGIDRRVYKTALTQVGVNFAMYKMQFKDMVLIGVSEEDAIKLLAKDSLDAALSGLADLGEKYGTQPEIVAAISGIRKYCEG